MSICTCNSLDLLNFGCTCGFLNKSPKAKDEACKTKTSLQVHIQDRQLVIGGFRIGFICAGNDEEVSVSFKWECTIAKGNTEHIPAILGNNSHGRLVMTPWQPTEYIISGLKADSKTKYWVHWNTTNADKRIQKYGSTGPLLIPKIWKIRKK